MKLDTLYEDQDRLSRLIEKVKTRLNKGINFNKAIFDTVAGLGLTNIQDRRRIGEQIRAEMQRRSAYRRKQEKRKEVQNYFFA